MSKPLLRATRWGKAQAYVSVEEGATLGAEVGVNLLLNGVVVRAEDILNAFTPPGLANFNILGPQSVRVQGAPSQGNVSLTLVNDVSAPVALSYYRTDADGVKGWSFIKPDELPISLLGVYPKDEDGNYMVDENNSFMMTDLLHQMSADPDSPISNVQRAFDVMLSPGIVTGGEVTELTSTSVRITGGTALLRVADDNYSELRFFRFDSQDFSVPDVQVTHFYALDYNGGSPIMVESTVTENWDRDTQIPLGSALRGNGLLNITPNPYRTGDVITNLIQRLDAIGPVQRDNSIGGLQIGETGTRNVTVSAGRLWARVSDFTIPSKNSATDTMASVFFNGTNLTVTSGLTQWDNLNFNNLGTGSLQLMGNNKYANLWFFMSFNGDHYGFAYGTNEYNTLGDAANEGVPAYLTQNFFNQFILLGRFVFQKSGATANIIESAFVTPFSSAAINTHNNLGGLQGGTTGEYYHLTAAQQAAVAAALIPGGGFVTVDDAQTVNGNKTLAGTTKCTGIFGTVNTQIRATDAALTSLVTSAGAEPRFQLAGTGASAGEVNNRTHFGIARFFNDSGGVNIYLVKSRGAAINDNTVAVVNGDTIGQFLFEAAHGSGLTRGAVYRAQVDAAPSGTTVAMRHVWSTMNTSGVLADRWQIGSEGNLRPSTNIAHDVGASTFRVRVVYAQNIDQSGARLESGVVSPAQLTANTDNWAVTGITTAAIIRATTDASRNLTGIASPTAGQMVRLINVGTQDLVLVHDATSTAANRFFLPNSANLTLNPNDSVSLWYDNTSSRWRALGV